MGRKKIPAVPAAVAPAAPAPATPALDTARAMVAQAKAKQATGKNLQNHEARALRDAWLLEQALHIWPSMAAAAADLGLGLSTLRGFADEGCPGLEPHSPIPKSPVLEWLLKRAHERGGKQHANRDAIEDVELRMKLAKVEEYEKRLVADAEDRATQALLATMAELREQLLKDLPGQLAADARAGADLSAAEEIVRTLLTDALRDRSLTTSTTSET